MKKQTLIEDTLIVTDINKDRKVFEKGKQIIIIITLTFKYYYNSLKNLRQDWGLQANDWTWRLHRDLPNDKKHSLQFGPSKFSHLRL